jgi:hypothetical protein
MVSEPSRIALKVFSLLGQEVADLDASIRPAGIYSISWNGHDLSGKRMPSGLYYYQLKVTPLSQRQPVVFTKKMIMTD